MNDGRVVIPGRTGGPDGDPDSDGGGSGLDPDATIGPGPGWDRHRLAPRAGTMCRKNAPAARCLKSRLGIWAGDVGRARSVGDGVELNLISCK